MVRRASPRLFIIDLDLAATIGISNFRCSLQQFGAGAQSTSASVRNHLLNFERHADHYDAPTIHDHRHPHGWLDGSTAGPDGTPDAPVALAGCVVHVQVVGPDHTVAAEVLDRSSRFMCWARLQPQVTTHPPAPVAAPTHLAVAELLDEYGELDTRLRPGAEGARLTLKTFRVR